MLVVDRNKQLVCLMRVKMKEIHHIHSFKLLLIKYYKICIIEIRKCGIELIINKEKW